MKRNAKNEMWHYSFLPPSPVSVKIKTGIETGQSKVVMSFCDYVDHNQKNIVTLKVLNQVLKIVLTKRLREKENGIYAISVLSVTGKFPKGYYFTDVSFTASPNQSDQLIAAVKEEINILSKNGCDEYILSKIKKDFMDELKTALRSSASWSNYLIQQVKNEEDFAEIIDQKAIIENITSEDIRRASVTYLKQQNLSTIILYPKPQRTSNSRIKMS